MGVVDMVLCASLLGASLLLNGHGAGSAADVMGSNNQSEVFDKLPTPAPTPQPPAFPPSPPAPPPSGLPCCPSQIASPEYVECCAKCAAIGFNCMISTCDCGTFSGLTGGASNKCASGDSPYR